MRYTALFSLNLFIHDLLVFTFDAKHSDTSHNADLKKCFVCAITILIFCSVNYLFKDAVLSSML